MAQIVDFTQFRIYRACRDVEQTSQRIQADLALMRLNTQRAHALMAEAGKTLEQSLASFDKSQQRLLKSGVYHKKMMRRVDRIMQNSPAFDALR